MADCPTCGQRVPEDPSDVLRARDYTAWIAQPGCEATHANLKTYLTYGCVRRGQHNAHQDVLGDEWEVC